LHPDKPDQENAADDEAQLHLSPHRGRVYQRVRCFTIADERVNQHNRADPVNGSIQQAK
jgi:hypothetical protein